MGGVGLAFTGEAAIGPAPDNFNLLQKVRIQRGQSHRKWRAQR
jgi:hypothetical protein